MASRAAADSPQGTVSFLSIIIDAITGDFPLVEINALTIFACRLLKWCPMAVEPALIQLSREAAEGNTVSIAVLLGVSKHISASRFASPHPIPIVAALLSSRAQLAEKS